MPNCHETVGSFQEQPERQGTPAMTLYNARKGGDNLLYLQLWRRDCDDPRYAKAVLEAWEKYGALPLDGFKAQLIADGLYVEKSDFHPGARRPTAGPAPGPE